MSQPPKTPALARCGSDSCGHIWIVFWFPMPASNIQRSMLRCPYCGEKNTFMAGPGDLPAYREQLEREMHRLDLELKQSRADESEAP